MTPKETENARRLAAATLRGTTPAPARPALAFTLDATTPSDVTVWATRSHVECSTVRPGLVRCTDVAPGTLGVPAATGRIDELSLEFDEHAHLVNVTALRSHMTPAEAAAASQAIVSALNRDLGPPAGASGEFGESRFAATGAGSISAVAYRFDDYVADVTAMNTPSGGPSVREHFMSTRTAPPS